MAFPYGNEDTEYPPMPGMPGNGENEYPVSGGFPTAPGNTSTRAPNKKQPQTFGTGNILNTDYSEGMGPGYIPMGFAGSTPEMNSNYAAPAVSNTGQLQVSAGNMNGGEAFADNTNGGSGDGGFPYMLDTSKHQLDPRYIERMRDIAFDDPGNSPWLKYQMDQDQLRQKDDRQTLTNSGASNMASQQGNMAMRGASTSGSTERLGRQNLMSQLQGQQNLSRGAAGREGAYRQQAEERQRNILKMLPQAEVGYSQYGADLDKYNVDQMNQAGAAQRESDAIANQGQGQQFLPGMKKFDPSQW